MMESINDNKGLSTTELTNDYINNHPDIKICLKKGLINYSSLARLISKELNIEKSSSKEAILIASRRYRDKLKLDENNDQKIRDILKKSEMSVRNKIVVFIIERNLNVDNINSVESEIRKNKGTVYLIEGSDNYTLITQEKYAKEIEKQLGKWIISSRKNLVLINFQTPKEVENTRGFDAFMTSLFSENNVNIIEFLGCWTDTLFIINEEDINKAMNFLKF